MIIFTHDKNLIEPIIIKSKCKFYKILNLSSMYSGYEDITNLITTISRFNQTQLQTNVFVDSYEFDMAYATEINNNPEMYASMLNIVLNSYNGYCVIVLVYRDPYRDIVMESLIKYIQQMYYHLSWIVEDIEDVADIKDVDFTIEAMLRINDDMRRYDDLYARGLISNHIIDPICSGG